jgi:dihydropyrimidinase
MTGENAASRPAGHGFDLVVRNGTVVTACGSVLADVAVAGGRIAAIGHGLEAKASLDAHGLLVIPGGVDPHVHLQYPQGPHRVVSSDDWLTGTLAAACGGTTTIVDFVEAGPAQTWMQAFEQRRAEAEPQAAIDFGFHMTFNRVDAVSLRQVPAAVEAGMPSFKIYMAYDGLRLTDAEMLTALEALAEHAGLPLVHAENHDVIGHLARRQRDAGHVEPRWHPFAHPAAGEVEATGRALALAEIAGVPMHIVHVSAEQAVGVLRRSRRRGQPITAEVCTQHLLLTDALYDAHGFGPAIHAMAPPLRSAADAEAMWRGLQSGEIDFVVTDHCPFTRAQRRGERRTPEFRRLPGEHRPAPPEDAWWEGLPPFDRMPGGVPGIETRMALVHHFGVNEERLTLSRFVDATSTSPARRFGLYPRKGAILPGADADLVLFDPPRDVTITAEALHQNCDFTPYEGVRVRGWPRTVLSRGEIIVRDGVWGGSAGRGRYLPRRIVDEEGRAAR